jgi:peptide chain release factor subunit 1
LFAQKTALFHACHLATTNSVKQHKLKKLIASLSDREGRGKEFVTIYVPPSSSIDEVVAVLKRESNEIPPKSDSAQDRLQEVLKNTIQNLKQLKEIPDNGLAIFSGTLVKGKPEVETLEFREIVPPEPITRYLFEICNYFQLEPLREMLRNQKVVGVIALDSKEAGFGILNGEQLELVGEITSGIPGKSGKGGQSQRRYERERNMELTYFFHRIAEHATKTFLENNKITVLIVGGPGPTHHDFLKSDYLNYELKNAILSTVDTQSAGFEGVKEALSKSSEELKNMCAPEEKNAVQRLLAELDKQDGLAIYGLELILDALKIGEVEIVLVNDNTDIVENAAVCKKCGLLKTMVADKKSFEAIRKMNSTPCVRCGATEYEVEEKDIVDVLEDAASNTDATVEVISAESQEKANLTALGGFGAILRYRST